MAKFIAVVPVKSKSERVENKNFRVFANDLTLLEFKIKQLVASNSFDQIFISSNSEIAQDTADKFGVKHIWRDDSFCNNQVPWSDVIHHVVSSIPGDDHNVVCWCHTTSPLFNRYSECIEKYKEIENSTDFDGLATVQKFSEFIVNEKSRPVNYNWGIWHDYSQNLEKLYLITGALFMGKKETLMKCRYVMGRRPFLFQCNPVESVDIDTEYDFKVAQLFHKEFDSLV